MKDKNLRVDTHTITGRIIRKNSASPNIQQIQIRTPEGSALRDAYIRHLKGERSMMTEQEYATKVMEAAKLHEESYNAETGYSIDIREAVERTFASESPFIRRITYIAIFLGWNDILDAAKKALGIQENDTVA